MTIVLSAGGIFAAGFIQKLAEDAYAGVRAQFLEIMHKAREGNRRRGERVTETAIHVGDLRLYLELWDGQKLTDAQLRERFAAAADVVRRLPARAFEGGASAPEYGLRWDEDSRSWVGTIMLPDGIIYVPPAGTGEPKYIPEPEVP